VGFEFGGRRRRVLPLLFPGGDPRFVLCFLACLFFPLLFFRSAHGGLHPGSRLRVVLRETTFLIFFATATRAGIIASEFHLIE
jgi:hypothetical protein